MRGSKLTKQRIYFSRQKDNMLRVEDALMTEPVQKTMMFKSKLAHKKKPYRIHVQQRPVNRNAEFALLPSKEQQLAFVNNFIKRSDSKTEVKLCTYEILRHLQVRCSEEFFNSQNNFFPLRSREGETSNAKVQLESKRTSATPEVISRLFNNSRTSINYLENNEVFMPEEVKEIGFPFSLSKSQARIKSSSVKKSMITPSTIMPARPKPLTKLKSFRSSDDQDNKKKVENLEKPLLNYNYLELKHIKSESFAMIEADTEQLVILSKGKISLQIASITKIMTAYLILSMVEKRSIDRKSEKIEVQEYVEKTTGTSAELICGDIYTVEQLLYGLLLPSGNDAALVLADWGGSIINKEQGKQSEYRENVATFVQEMTRTARELGLKDTRYGNPHGLPHPEGRSTAIDQCKLAAKCMRNSTFKQIVKTKVFKFEITNSQNRRRQIVWQNTNKLLRREGFIGLKTGITVTAGPCLLSAYEFKDKVYILTVLRANKVSRRFKDTRKILHWTLTKLYEGKTYFQESYKLEELKKNKRQLDSDYSEDEKEFVYGEENSKELTRRKNILINEL